MNELTIIHKILTYIHAPFY